MMELSAENFEKEVLHSRMPVLVDFWAPWCGPCTMVGPVLEKLSHEYNGKMKFSKLNVDEAQELAAKFDVRGIPCMIVFSNGNEVERVIGQWMNCEDLRLSC